PGSACPSAAALAAARSALPETSSRNETGSGTSCRAVTAAAAARKIRSGPGRARARRDVTYGSAARTASPAAQHAASRGAPPTASVENAVASRTRPAAIRSRQCMATGSEDALGNDDDVARAEVEVWRLAVADLLDRDGVLLLLVAVHAGDRDGVLLRHGGEATRLRDRLD